MNQFFNLFEEDICLQFKLHPEAKKDQIQELLRQETEQKQAQLEAEALKEWESKQKEEEAKQAEQAKLAPTGKGGAKQAGKKQKDEKPQLDVPKLEVPQVTSFKSEMTNTYVRERTFDEIATKLMEPPKDD